MSKLQLAPAVIKAREAAQEERDSKPMSQVKDELRKERRARQRLVFKRLAASR